MMKMDSVTAAMVALHEGLTAPDKEDWNVLPLKNGWVHVSSFRENENRDVFCRAGESTVAEMKSMTDRPHS